MDAALDAALLDAALLDAALFEAALLDTALCDASVSGAAVIGAAVTDAAVAGAPSGAADCGAAFLGSCARAPTFPSPVNVPRRPSLAVHSIRPPGVETCAQSLHDPRNSEVCSHYSLEVAGLTRRSFEGLVAEAEHVRLRDAAGSRMGHSYYATVGLGEFDSGSEDVTESGACHGWRRV